MIDTVQIHHDAGKFNIVVTDEIVREYIKTIERDGKPIGLMKQPLVLFCLTTIGLEAGLSMEQARELAVRLLIQYQPFKIHDFSHYCNSLEFKRLHALYLMLVSDIDFLRAWNIANNGQFWQQFFPGTKISGISLPVLYGSPEEVQKAQPIQRKQAIDLIILKECFDDYAAQLIGCQVAEFADENNNLRDQYIKSKEIALAHIRQLIIQPSAQAWLSTENVFKYNVDWLMDIWRTAINEIVQEKQLDKTPQSYSIKYPALLVDGYPAMTVENGRIKIVNSQLTNSLCRKLIGKIEVVDRVLAEYFLTVVIVNTGKHHLVEAKKLVKKFMDIADTNCDLKNNNCYKKFDLYNAYRDYLINTVSNANYRGVKYFYKFWRTLFPDTGALYDYLPNLVGSANNVKRADAIRRRQIENLLDLKHLIGTANEQVQISSKAHKKLIDALDRKAIAYINQTIIRNNAQDWISSRSVEYNWNWLHPKMEEFWAEVRSECGVQEIGSEVAVQDSGHAQRQDLPMISSQAKQSNIIKIQKPPQQTVQGYEVNILMLGKLRGQVKATRAAKDDGITLEENEDTDLRIFDFQVKEHRLMCLEAMKNLVRAGYFELDSIAIDGKGQPEDPKIAIKTYNITEKGLAAPLLTPIQNIRTV